MSSYIHKLFRALITLVFALGLIPPSLQSGTAHAQGGFNMPFGFIQETVAVGMTLPTSFAIAPDGRIFVAEKGGKVRVIVDGQLLPEPFIDLSYEVNDSADRGMLGIAVHPDWPATPYVYLSYVYDPPEIKDRNPGGARVSHVLRLSADPNNLNVAQAGSGVVIVGTNSTAEHVGNPDEGDTLPFSCLDDSGAPVRDCIAAEGTAHTLGQLVFGPDGALYVASGDGIVNSKGNARALDVNSLNGKILRVNPITGEGYSSNPFFDGDPGSNRSKVFVLGMRNPFRFAILPSGEVILGDVGNDNWEEINRGGPGANFGWPCYEGPYEAATYANCDALRADGSVTQAIYFYPHTTKPQRGSAIGGDIYRGSVFPPLYRGAYFFHDFNGGVVDMLTFNGDGTVAESEFASNVPGAVQITDGGDGALYVLSVILGGLWRIRYMPGGNKPPTADADADPTGGQAPLEVNFSSKRSTDPEKSLVAYLWDFGDGDTSNKANPAHTYEQDGVYTAELTVTDSAGATSTDSIAIAVGSEPPVAKILEPGDGAKFRIGESIKFAGKGTDPDEGDLSGSSLQWNAILHHNEHIHYDAFKAEGAGGAFPYVDHGDNTYLELCLTVTDAQGLQDTDCVDLKAQEVTYTFNTVPAGLPITYAGSRYETPFKVKTYINAKRIIEAPGSTGNGLTFASWSDGGEAAHEMVVQDGAQTLTASYADDNGKPFAEDSAAADLAEAPLVSPADAGDATDVPAPAATTPAAAAGAKIQQAGTGTGGVLFERWDDISGGTIEELTKSPQYRSGEPSVRDTLAKLELPRNGGSEYGVRLRGYLHPPSTGDYRFWIAADDRGALLLSSDDDPDNKITVAFTPGWTAPQEWEKYPEQITGPLELEAGKRYYIEVLYKQDGQKDNLAVAWQPPGGQREVIDGQYLSPYNP